MQSICKVVSSLSVYLGYPQWICEQLVGDCWQLWLQGVPKVRSSNFMDYNFSSKLYFYMKFLENVYFSIKYMYSEFQYLAYPFCFFIKFCSCCGMKWDTAFGSILRFFITWCAGSSSSPKQNLFSLGSWKKHILGIHPKKKIIPAPFHSKAFVLLYKFETSWALFGRLSRDFFCHLRGL